MKYLLLAVLLLIPPALAVDELHLIEDGIMTISYPDEAVEGERVNVNVEVQLESNTVRKLEFQQPEFASYECGLAECSFSYNFLMAENPVAISMVLELEESRPAVLTTIPNFGENTPNYFFGVASGDSTLSYVSFITILPEIPETVKILESSPRLEDEIIFLVTEVTSRELLEDDFDKHKENAQKAFTITKSAELKTVGKGNEREIKTAWTIKLELNRGYESAKDIYVYEEVPKEGAPDFNSIIDANYRFTVLKEDPIIMWHFAEINEPVEITYETSKASITGAATIVTAAEVERGTQWQIIIPMLLIPIIAGLVIFFARFKKKEQTENSQDSELQEGKINAENKE